MKARLKGIYHPRRFRRVTLKTLRIPTSIFHILTDGLYGFEARAFFNTFAKLLAEEWEKGVISMIDGVAFQA